MTSLMIVSDLPYRTKLLDPVWIRMSDGARLAARIFLPVDADQYPVPAILEYTPYRRRDFSAGSSSIDRYLAGHGYAVARVDIRGCGDSDGLHEGEYLKTHELEDGVEVIRWLAQQTWCTGAVGMMGASWSGFNALQIAALQPPELKAIITAYSSDDRYRDDLHYMGGCLLNANIEWGTTMYAYHSRPPDPQIVGASWHKQWIERLKRQTHWSAEWLRHQCRDEFWKQGSVCENYTDIQCAVYAVGGWADGFTNAVLRLMAGLSCPRKGLIGPWAHTMPHAGGPGPQIGWLQESLRWWDHWLKAEKNGIMDEPLIRIWMQESVEPKPHYAHRPGRWIAETEWPSPSIEMKNWPMVPATIEESTAEDIPLVLYPHQLVGITSGAWMPYGIGAELPLDQREDDAFSLCFDSAPLEETLELLGIASLTLELEVDRPQAFLSVRLNDVRLDGQVTRVSYGILNLTHRNTHEHPDPVSPGKRFTVAVQLNAIAHAFPRGHRMRVSISTSYWPMIWPSPEPVILKVFPANSRLTLPVRRPQRADLALPEFGPPECAESRSITTKRTRENHWEIQRDILKNEVRVLITKDRGAQYLEDLGLHISSCNYFCYSIQPSDPLSARIEESCSISMEGDGWCMRSEVQTTFSSTVTDFVLSAQMRVTDKEGEVFQTQLNERIRRNGM